MFAYIFGGAISGSVAGLPADHHPRHPRPDRADRLHGDRRPAPRGHGQGRLRPVQVAADRPDRPAGRADAIADLLRYAHRGHADDRSPASLMGYRPGGGARRRSSAAWLLTIIAGWSLAWIFTWLGTIGPQRPGGPGHLDDDHVPADLPVQRVRPGRHPARLAAGLRERQPGLAMWSPPSGTSLNDGPGHRRRSAGRSSAARSWSRSSRRWRCGPTAARCS